MKVHADLQISNSFLPQTEHKRKDKWHFVASREQMIKV